MQPGLHSTFFYTGKDSDFFRCVPFIIVQNDNQSLSGIQILQCGKEIFPHWILLPVFCMIKNELFVLTGCEIRKQMLYSALSQQATIDIDADFCQPWVKGLLRIIGVYSLQDFQPGLLIELFRLMGPSPV